MLEAPLDGKTSKEIAVVLRTSARTVEGHRRIGFVTMHVSSATQLVRTVLSVWDATPR